MLPADVPLTGLALGSGPAQGVPLLCVVRLPQQPTQAHVAPAGRVRERGVREEQHALSHWRARFVLQVELLYTNKQNGNVAGVTWGGRALCSFRKVSIMVLTENCSLGLLRLCRMSGMHRLVPSSQQKSKLSTFLGSFPFTRARTDEALTLGKYRGKYIGSIHTWICRASRRRLSYSTYGISSRWNICPSAGHICQSPPV
jgi:hypothetical protein